jgi:predicted metal-dependent peptidase
VHSVSNSVTLKLALVILIIFTDGDGRVPQSCNQRVLWVIKRGGKKPAEFGEHIIFESLEEK